MVVPKGSNLISPKNLGTGLIPLIKAHIAIGVDALSTIFCIISVIFMESSRKCNNSTVQANSFSVTIVLPGAGQIICIQNGKDLLLRFGNVKQS